MKLYQSFLARSGRTYVWRNQAFAYRCDPVPRIHRYCASGYNVNRSPRTTQECRASFLTEDEKYYGVKIRAKRKANNLPDTWDDYTRSDWNAKSWKHYRKKQYKKSQ